MRRIHRYYGPDYTAYERERRERAEQRMACVFFVLLIGVIVTVAVMWGTR